jgi:hypothetical protein
MWVSCPEEYRIVKAESWTDNNVFPFAEEDGTHGILLRNQLQNTIQITCEVKP